MHSSRYLLLSVFANIHHTQPPTLTSTNRKFSKSSMVLTGTWNELGRIFLAAHTATNSVLRHRYLYCFLLLSSATSSHLLGYASQIILSSLERAISNALRSWCYTVVVWILSCNPRCMWCADTLGTYELINSVLANMVIMDVGYFFLFPSGMDVKGLSMLGGDGLFLWK